MDEKNMRADYNHRKAGHRAMPKIKALDQTTIAKIAAGEVVERPASVIKELVENALDAGSTEIVIELDEGGRNLIRISDNGCGMEPEDVERSVQSHATSKIAAIEDLDSLATLGFRGEALNSIAAVSRMSIVARTPDNDTGHRVVVHGGETVASEPAARVPGTTIEVANLFYNVPARLKFMKSARSEIQAVNTLVSRFIIAHPGVAFRLTNNDREVLSAPVAETRLDRLAMIMGKDIAAHIHHAGGTLKNQELTAWFCMPDLSFPNRKYQIFYVNGHLVKDRTMGIAVDVAYKGLISRGRFALAVLFLDMPATQVDVNVHPAKTEVRFHRPHDVHSLIYRTLREQFMRAEQPDPEPFTLVVDNQPKTLPPPEEDRDVSEPGVKLYEKKRKAPLPKLDPKQAGRQLDEMERSPAPPEPRHDLKLDAQKPPPDDLDTELERQTELALSPERGQEAETRPAQAFDVLGQFYNTFIMVNIEGQPVFIDQHVAAERVIYNRLKQAGTARPSQMTLLAEPVEVPRDVFDTLSANPDLIKKAGLEIEPFGDRAFVIRSVVHNAGDFDALEMLVSLAEDIAGAPYAASPENLLDRVLVTASCKLAVKAGQPLSREEMTALVADYLAADFNRTCPHGRPIMHKVSLRELKAWFKR